MNHDEMKAALEAQGYTVTPPPEPEPEPVLVEGLDEVPTGGKDDDPALPDWEQLQVQLAGCLTAAEGGTSESVVAVRGQYGWSPAYQAVLDLRNAFDQLSEGLPPEAVLASALPAEQDWREVARCIPPWEGAKLTRGDFVVSICDGSSATCGYASLMSVSKVVALDHGPTFREAAHQLATDRFGYESRMVTLYHSTPTGWWLETATKAWRLRDASIDLPHDTDPKLVLALAWQKHLDQQ